MKKTILKRNKKPYLIRYTLFKCKWFSIKLHKTLISDIGDLHDHPWNYISLILWGGYWEWTYIKLLNKQFLAKKWYCPGSILFRKANIPHKLEIPTNKYCISLIFTSYKLRDWGFTKNNDWISHKYQEY
jgi:hypothetical protein